MQKMQEHFSALRRLKRLLLVPYLLHPCSRRQLLSYMDVMNAENAGAFFRPASLKRLLLVP